MMVEGASGDKHYTIVLTKPPIKCSQIFTCPCAIIFPGLWRPKGCVVAKVITMRINKVGRTHWKLLGKVASLCRSVAFSVMLSLQGRGLSKTLEFILIRLSSNRQSLKAEV